MPPNDEKRYRASTVSHGFSISYDGRREVVRAQAIATETPVNIVYGAMPFAVMMATPQDLHDFAYGFSFTEGIVDGAEDIRGVEVEQADGGIRVTVGLRGALMQRHLSRVRTIAGRSGCGVCGIADLSQMPVAARRIAGEPIIAASAISRALASAEEAQALNRQTHAVHGAMFCDSTGKVLAAREDVGRHNALDKLIGALLRSGQEPGNGFVLITSRASYEMVEKTARLGAGVLVAMSAPTSLAIERAEAYGMTLAGIARPDGAVIFTGKSRVETGTR